MRTNRAETEHWGKSHELKTVEVRFSTKSTFLASCGESVNNHWVLHVCPKARTTEQMWTEWVVSTATSFGVLW
jgi:hypothetical protein